MHGAVGMYRMVPVQDAVDPAGAGRGIYFSHFHDVTQSAQRGAAQAEDAAVAAKPLAARADPWFMYNRSLAAPLLEAKAARCVPYSHHGPCFMARRPPPAQRSALCPSSMFVSYSKRLVELSCRGPDCAPPRAAFCHGRFVVPSILGFVRQLSDLNFSGPGRTTLATLTLIARRCGAVRGGAGRAHPWPRSDVCMAATAYVHRLASRRAGGAG